ncbi:MAG: toll/interleukin-1 receptor domain-containing protein [Candidatus Binatia bacterium]
MAKLFISYASNDRDFVDRLATALDLAGHEVWFDRDLNAGSFRDQILVQLTQAEVAIVVWSARSKQSRYVIDESERAVARGVLLPIRIDHTDLPLGFGGFQTFDLSSWSGRADDPKFTLILDQIDRILKNPATPPGRPAVPFVKRSLLLAVLLAAICAPALAWLYAVKSSDPDSTAQWHSLLQAFALAAACTAPVMLWCGFEVGRFGLSHSAPILRRALAIYATSAILAMAVVTVAVVRGEAAGLTRAAALGQIFFVALLATLTLGAFIAILRATSYLIRKLRM